MSTIIVPTDFSPTAAAALRYANFLAEATGLSLEVIHVHDGYGHSEDPKVRKGSPEARQLALRAIDQFIRLTLPAVAYTHVAGTAGEEMQISRRELIGSPEDMLIAEGKKSSAALIVMGGVGSGKVSTVTPLFGSVARSVAERTACPILLVPKDYGEPKLAAASLAFHTAAELRQISDGFTFIRTKINPTVRLVHVRDFSEQAELRKENALVDEILDKGFPGYAVELDLLDPGDVEQRLLEYAGEETVDLLVMGRRQRGFFQRLFGGSQVTGVLDRAGVPMLVVPVA